MKKWENLSLFKAGKKLLTHEDFDCWLSEHCLFELVARFNNVSDAEMFAKMKSKKSKSYVNFSVTKNLSGDPLGEYYVYFVLCQMHPDPFGYFDM